MSRAFVIHRHSGFGAVHYDLMLQSGPALATWRLEASPVAADGPASLPARKIQDHRPAYLNYEGPVSGGRGVVAAVDRGSYELLAADDSRWVVVFHGQVLRGTYELRRCDAGGDEWIFGPA